MTGKEYVHRNDLHPFWDFSRDPNVEDVSDAFEQSKAEAYKETLSFLDTLEEYPVSNDLEEACDEYYDETWDEHGGKAMVVDGCHDIWFPSQATDDFFKAGAQWQQQKTDKDMIEALRTEYEKGRADVIADTLSWLENCWPRYCSNQTIIEGFKEAIKGE